MFLQLNLRYGTITESWIEEFIMREKVVAKKKEIK